MRFATLLLAATLLTGCSSFLSKQIVKAPNHRIQINTNNDPDALALKLLGVDHQFRVTVGPPDASLHIWVVDPSEEQYDQPRGTVMLLHGVADGKIMMLGKAKDFAKDGYRAVLVDLRGHGRSSGDFHTFGVVEKRDLSQVIDDLQRRDLVAGKLGVFGVSYGASTAIELAGYDERVSAVVAVAGFSSMREAVPPFSKTLLPVPGVFFSGDQYNQMIDEAGQIAHFNPDEASAERAISRTRAPVLIIHGKWDRIVPPDNAQRLFAASNARSELLMVDGHGHLTIWFDPTGVVHDRANAWFESWLDNAGDGTDSSARDALRLTRLSQ